MCQAESNLTQKQYFKPKRHDKFIFLSHSHKVTRTKGLLVRSLSAGNDSEMLLSQQPAADISLSAYWRERGKESCRDITAVIVRRQK